jgi:hypothetical protein
VSRKNKQREKQLTKKKTMKGIWENLKNWKLVATIAIVSLLTAYLFYNFLLPWVVALKNKATKATAAIALIGTLLFAMGANAATPNATAPDCGAILSVPAFSPGLAMVTPDAQLGGIIVGVFAVAIAALAIGFVSRKMGPARAVVALIFGAGILGLFAADYIERRITSLVINAGRGVDTTNGFIRVVSPNGTNWFQILTNGATKVVGNSGTYTGFTGITTWSNGNVYGTQYWWSGLLVGTNAAAGAVPAQF